MKVLAVWKKDVPKALTGVNLECDLSYGANGLLGCYSEVLHNIRGRVSWLAEAAPAWVVALEKETGKSLIYKKGENKWDKPGTLNAEFWREIGKYIDPDATFHSRMLSNIYRPMLIFGLPINYDEDYDVVTTWSFINYLINQKKWYAMGSPVINNPNHPLGGGTSIIANQHSMCQVVIMINPEYKTFTCKDTAFVVNDADYYSTKQFVDKLKVKSMKTIRKIFFGRDADSSTCGFFVPVDLNSLCNQGVSKKVEKS